VLQLLEDFVTQTPTGALSLDPAGGTSFPRPYILDPQLRKPAYVPRGYRFS